MRIIFFGTPEFAETILRYAARRHDIAVVVTMPDRPAGRGKKLTPPPVRTLAESLGVPVLQPESRKTPEFADKLRAFAADINVTAAYGGILPEAVLGSARLGSVNVHASLLPEYRGAAPIARAVIDGRRDTGVTIMRMDTGLDTGDIILQRKLPIAPEDTCGSLTRKLAESGAGLLLEALALIEDGTAAFTPQDGALATYAKKISPEEQLIDWNLTAESAANLIRGLNPAPGAYTFYRGDKLRILFAEPLDGDFPGAPGEVIGPLIVKAVRGAVRAVTVQAAGGRPMSAGDYLRGHRVEIGEKLDIDV
ncbi:MAG: methionyl-tRNA formyltransferase [Clostridiales bacterium]|jgi:methionyl-tRNA formyltransferase|nr:methionyl-tRNA formyltransferase [Clostridiales bacterium]